tara:strand:+ start:1084 stop:1962 length:879 start_codon:yes stop_codon:yes gene_type:complete
MHLYLSFPASPGAEIIKIGLYSIRWYGFLISLSVLLGLYISKKLANFRGIDPNYVSMVLPTLIINSIIGARIYYVLFELRQFTGYNFFTNIKLLNLTFQFPSFLAVWEGGIAIHGALIGGSLSIFFFCRSKKISFKTFLDIIIPSVILGQAIGRWGNYFNNEAFGIPTNLPWKLFIPLINRPFEFEESTFFHPTFLYESVWNFLIFTVLIYIFYRQSKSKLITPGIITCTYIITYSFGRFWIEGLRIDSLCLGSIPPFCDGGLKIAQFISICLFSSGFIWLYFLKLKNNKNT